MYVLFYGKVQRETVLIVFVKKVRVTDFCDASVLVNGKSQYCWLFIMTFDLYLLDIKVFVR